MPDKSVSIGGRKVTIADMRHRITFQFVTRTPDGQGGFTEVWANLASVPTVWAFVCPVAARERLFSSQVQYQRTHKVAMRYRSDITTEMRFLYDGRTFQLHGTIQPDGRKFFMVVDAEENQGT